MHPFQNAALPVDGRVADLLARMTLEEKAGQLSQYFYLGVPEGIDIDSVPLEQRSFLQQPKMVEAAVAAGGAGSVLLVKDADILNRLQHMAVDGTRLGIPLLFGFDVIHGLRTVLPVPVGLAATWSPALIEQAQTVAAREARAVGIHWTFAPMIDIARDPRWGRIVEGAGEDPVLGAAVAAAQVRGFQGALGDDRILAGPKHLAGYGASRGGRDYDDVEVSDSELWNVYLPPFRAAVQAGAANVMAAYMDLNGVPAAANRWLLTDVLRDEFGFQGFTVSDANAVRSLEVQHLAEDLTDAAARALRAGLDMEMATFNPAYSRLPAAVADGTIDEEALDVALRRVLTAKFRLGLFEQPYVDASAAAATLNAPAHREIARDAAAQSFVLLKNELAVLPLTAGTVRSVAVIGQLAASRRDTLGPWVFDHDVDETVTILDGLRSRLGDEVTVEFAPGVGIPERTFPSIFDTTDLAREFTPSDHDDDHELDRALELTTASDVAIVVVGQRQNQIGEKASASTLDLPGRQLEQLQKIAATGTPVVLVVMSGRPVDLRWAQEHVPAILQVWYPGTRGGEAVAAVLLGDRVPAGRLPFTWPQHVGQVPMIYNHNRTFAPEDQSKRYWNEESAPLYPFGHGLSYATFDYSALRLSASEIPRGDTVKATVQVANVSAYDADEVVQLYIHQRSGTSSRPIRELKAFQRVAIPARTNVTVSFDLGPEQLRYWSAATRDHVQDAAVFDIWVGADSNADLGALLRVTP